MNWVTALGVYFVLWWLVFFTVLPVGIQPGGATLAGNDPGAPSNPRLWWKAGITSLLTLIPFGLLYWIVAGGIVTFEDIDWTNW